MSSSPLFTSLTKPVFLEEVLEKSLRTREPVIVVSSVCPPYSTSQSGAPNYEALNSGIEHNIFQHLIEVPKGVNLLQNKGIEVVHFFLMADTEVDFLPFLRGLAITAEEFTRRCQASVETIALEVKKNYPQIDYERYGVPPAARFLAYFREESWYMTYGFFKQMLIFEAERDNEGRVVRGLQRDAEYNKKTIDKLFGRPTTLEERINHICRQKAQYMTFAKLMRERFGGRQIVINHKTPNFEWMNDQLARLHPDPNQAAKGNCLSKIPLIQLNITTVPED